MKVVTIKSFDTEYPADSIEWCPHPDFRSFFVCGTYQLENSQSYNRKGRIHLIKFDIELYRLTEEQRIETAAVLDMKWLPKFDIKPILAVGNALGQIELYTLENTELKLCSLLDLNLENEKSLTLSIDWQCLSSFNEFCYLLASDSKGNVTLIKCTSENDLQIIHAWSAHNFEAWICAFDKWDTNRIYTGGDDSCLHVYDIRTYERVLTNKSHTAGVTCLLSHSKYENFLLTGSYDEHIREFDIRHMKQPLTELKLGGGIWRLKADPFDKNLILTACMYHNFSVIHIENFCPSKMTLVAEYAEHESICYGADWCQNLCIDDYSLFIATCSFYDHKLCVSKIF